MKRLGAHAADLLEQRNQEQRELLRRIEEAPSATCFVQSVLPELESVIPASVDANTLAAHARWELVEAHRRSRTCAGCPAEGGACDGASGYYAEGLRPEWRDGRLEPTPCAKWQPYREKRLLVRAGVPDVFISATLENYEATTETLKDAVDAVKHYVEHEADKGKSLLLEGDTGLGKTHLAVAALRLISRKRPRVVFAYVPEFVEMLRLEATHQDAAGLFEQAASSDVLVLDDLGAERPTEFAREKLEHLVNRRWTERRAMIVTQNVPPEALEDMLGVPLVRRITHATSVYVELRGEAYEG